MKEEKINVLYFPMFEEPRWLTIDNTLKAKQKLVEGFIEFLDLQYYDGPRGVELVVNEEGKFTYERNAALYDYDGNVIDYIAGPFFAVGELDGEGYSTSLSSEKAEKLLTYLRRRKATHV